MLSNFGNLRNQINSINKKYDEIVDDNCKTPQRRAIEP